MVSRNFRGSDPNGEITAIVFADLEVVACVTELEESTIMVGEASTARGMAVLVVATARRYGDIMLAVWWYREEGLKD
jgi:hypothetical protein